MYGSKIIVSLGFILLFYSMSANATLDFTFDISDTSWATETSDPTFTSGDTISVSFLDTADLGNLLNTDLVSWTWSVDGVTSSVINIFEFSPDNDSLGSFPFGVNDNFFKNSMIYR